MSTQAICKTEGCEEEFDPRPAGHVGASFTRCPKHRSKPKAPAKGKPSPELSGLARDLDDWIANAESELARVKKARGRARGDSMKRVLALAVLALALFAGTSQAASMKHCGKFKWPTPAQITARGINCHTTRDIASRAIGKAQEGKDPFYVRSPKGSRYRCTQLGGDGNGGLVCKRKSVRVELRIL